MNLPMKTVAPTDQHRAFRKALEAAMAEHAQTLDAVDILALLSHLVGQCIALQDRRIMTPSMAMELVSSNIEQGNREAIAPLLNQTGGSA